MAHPDDDYGDYDDLTDGDYEYARGVVEDGALTIVSKMSGFSERRMAHDEDVTGWSDKDLANVVRQMLGLSDGFNVSIQHM